MRKSQTLNKQEDILKMLQFFISPPIKFQSILFKKRLLENLSCIKIYVNKILIFLPKKNLKFIVKLLFSFSKNGSRLIGELIFYQIKNDVKIVS